MSNRRIVLSGGPWREIDRLNSRIAELEAFCKEMAEQTDRLENAMTAGPWARIAELESLLRDLDDGHGLTDAWWARYRAILPQLEVGNE